MSVFEDIQNDMAAIKGKFGGSAGNKQADAKEAAYPALAEPAMVHPHTNAVVKLRDNGAIDIFAADNTGMRLDLKNKSITMMSSLNQTRAETLRAIISKDATQDVKGKWTV